MGRLHNYNILGGGGGGGLNRSTGDAEPFISAKTFPRILELRLCSVI